MATAAAPSDGSPASPSPPPPASGQQPGSSSAAIVFLEVTGAVDDASSLIRYDVPYAPEDPKRSARLRHRMGLPPEERVADPNARAIIDGLIAPRRWTDASGVIWHQHASPFPAPRIDVVRTKERYEQLLRERGARPTGVCPIRTFLSGECFAEMIRQVVAESWERGLLLLKVHAERVMAQKAHRELFESRCGYALRLALKGEKDTAAMVARIEQLRQRKAQLGATEDEYKKKCEDIKVSSEEVLKGDEYRYNQELILYKREAAQKKTLLETLTAPTKKAAPTAP